VFLPRDDPKAHFGSVLSRVETLVQKSKFDDLPDEARAKKQFLIDILPQLHAVKDAWRDKVSHVGNNIIPSGSFTEEKATEIYNATVALMKNLAANL
jgi:hypothetical protein